MHRLIHLRLIRFRDLRNHRSVRGIHIRELPLSAHESTVNVILDYFHEIPGGSRQS
jgi:hypothetical protein